MSRVYLTVSKDGWSEGFQLSVDDESGGYRLFGPKFNGSSKPVIRHPLDARDCDELERYIAKARAGLSKALNTGDTHDRGDGQ